MNEALGAFFAIIVLGVLAYLIVQLRRKDTPSKVEVSSSIQNMRSIGELSVFKVVTKEIVTASDHSWGEFGEKYMRWVITNKKMVMIFEFEIEFRYDLRKPEFKIIEAEDNTFVIKMPSCTHATHIRDIKFYDEQKAKVMPWLLPDLLNGFGTGSFSEADKNRLVAAARQHAERQAGELILSLRSEAQNSARSTLLALGKAFGAKDVRFDFQPDEALRLDVGLSPKVTS